MDVWAFKDIASLMLGDVDEDFVGAALRLTCSSLKQILSASIFAASPLLFCDEIAETFPALRSLDLNKAAMSDRALGSLTRLTALQALTLRGQGCEAAMRSEGLATVAALTALRSLAICGCRKVQWSALSALRPLSQLTSLTLVGLTYQEAAAGQLGRLLEATPQLAVLALGDARGLCFISNAALAGIGGVAGSLVSLDLSGCIELTDAAWDHLAPLSRLSSLSLMNCMKMGAASVAAAAAGGRAAALRALSLRGCAHLTDEALLPLASLTSLTALNLQGCSISGACLQHLCARGLRALRALQLAQCAQLADASLAALARLPHLARLDLWDCQSLTPTGLAHLRALPQLRELDVSGFATRREAGGVDPTRPQADSVPPLAWVPPSVTRLSLARLCAPSSQQVALLGALPAALLHLDLAGAQLHAPGPALAAIAAAARQLRHLDLRAGLWRRQLALEHLAPLAALSALTQLCLAGVEWAGQQGGDDAGLAASSASAMDWHRPAAPMRRLLAAQLQGWPSTAADLPPRAGSCCSSTSSGGGSSCGKDSGGSDGSGGSRASGGAPQRCEGGDGAAAAVDDGGGAPLATRPVRRRLQLDALASLSIDSHDHAHAHPLPEGARVPSGPATLSCAEWLDAMAERLEAPRSSGAAAPAAAAAAPRAWHCPPPRLAQSGGWLVAAGRAQLRHLQLRDSHWACDAALEPALAALTALRSLDLAGCKSFGGEALAAAAGASHLTSLDLTGCGVTDAGLAFGAARLTRLRALALTRCGGYGDVGAAALSALTCLSALSVAGNRNVSHVGLAQGLPPLRHLRSLDLSMCWAVDDAALAPLAALPALAEVDVRCCWRITDSGVLELLAASTSLLRMQVQGCHRVSSACLRECGQEACRAQAAAVAAGRQQGAPSLIERLPRVA